MITESAPSPPPPPTASGRPAPSNPAPPALRCSSRGSSPVRSHSSTCGRTSRSAKARTVFRSCSRSGVCQMLIAVGSSPKGSSQDPFWDVDMPAAQPLAQPFGLWIEPCLIRDALPEDSVDDEVYGPQVGQQVAGDGGIGCVGQQF